jgi:hypothetical protein
LNIIEFIVAKRTLVIILLLPACQILFLAYCAVQLFWGESPSARTVLSQGEKERERGERERESEGVQREEDRGIEAKLMWHEECFNGAFAQCPAFCQTKGCS